MGPIDKLTKSTHKICNIILNIWDVNRHRMEETSPISSYLLSSDLIYRYKEDISL